MNYSTIVPTRSVPVFNWNSRPYRQVSLTRLFDIIDNHELGKSTRHYDWGCLSGCVDTVFLEEKRLPMIQLPEEVIGFKVNVTNNIYRCRLQINYIVESLPYTLGHFRPYKSNHIVVLVDGSTEVDQVIQDLEDRMVIVDHTPIDPNEMIKLTSDPYSWLRSESNPTLPA